MKHPHLTALCAALGVAALTAPALSYTTFASWPTINTTMSASGTSFPVGVWRDALGIVGDRFYYENPSDFWFTMAYDDSSVALGNGQNEVWFSGDPDHAPAVTFTWTSGSDLVEADVLFWVDEGWTTSTNKTSIWSYGGGSRPFQTTAIHEFGHAAGLGHEADEYNIMGQDWDHITCNGSTYRSYVGEDANDGLVSLYGAYSGGDIEDLGVTLFKYQGPSGAYSAHEPSKIYDTSGIELSSASHDGQRSYYINAGDTVRVEFTFENNGESYHSPIALEYYVSTNNTISTFDRLVGTGSIGMGRADVFTRYDLITLPLDLNIGQQYYLGVMIDSAYAYSEATEVNNFAYHAFTVTCDSVATTYNYNVGSNPQSLTTGLYTIGDPFSLTANVGMTGHSFGLVFGFDTPISIQLAGGQWLLCFDGGGSGEIFGFASKLGPIVSYTGVVPIVANHCGFSFTAQAIHYGGVVPFALSNARDINIGG